jgi:hypothetical protein
MVTTVARAIIRCFCSTSSAIWSAVRYAPATFAALTAGRACSSRSSSATRARSSAFIFAPTPPSPMGDVYEYLEGEGIIYAIRLPANRILQERISHLLTRPAGRPLTELRRFYASLSIRREAGRSRVTPSPRLGGIRASFIRASAPSSPTWRGPKPLAEEGICRHFGETIVLLRDWRSAVAAAYRTETRSTGTPRGSSSTERKRSPKRMALCRSSWIIAIEGQGGRLKLALLGCRLSKAPKWARFSATWDRAER